MSTLVLAMASHVVIVGSAVAGVLVIAVLFRKLRSRKKAKKTVPNGTVLLHQFPPMRGSVVNGSPPCLKLETYLRMAEIPYEIDDSGGQTSKKGKMPWIEYNGESIADSNFCIQFLKKEFRVDVDDHLSETERAIAHTILTTLEENTYW